MSQPLPYRCGSTPCALLASRPRAGRPSGQRSTHWPLRRCTVHAHKYLGLAAYSRINLTARFPTAVDHSFIMSTSIRSLGVADSNRIEDFSESNPKSALLALRARRETALNYIPVHTELTELLQNSRDSLSESERRSLESVLSRVRDGIEAVQLLQDATTTMDDTRAWCPHNVAYETLRDAGDNRATAYQRIIDESIETYRLYQDFVKKYDQDATSKTAPVPARVLEAMKGLSQLVQTPSIRGYTEDRWVQRPRRGRQCSEHSWTLNVSSRSFSLVRCDASVSRPMHSSSWPVHHVARSM